MAGLVGIGLSDLWAASGLEGPEFAGEEVGYVCVPCRVRHSFWHASAAGTPQQCLIEKTPMWLTMPCEHTAQKHQAVSNTSKLNRAQPLLQVLSNHMGLFLQKTNIIRDYLEDIVEEPAPRMFWPREVWGKHADQLADFKVGSQKGISRMVVWMDQIDFQNAYLENGYLLPRHQGECPAAKLLALACCRGQELWPA